MEIVRLRRGAAGLLAALALSAGCGDDQPSLPDGTLMPAFALQDVNPNSATALQSVSPRAYLNRASAWYFGHAT